MATTTPNFGWDIPQSTDLVKDGATAIAALGNDIDTSMVDLKGGTTGQILSKASNTDMDFTWTTPNPGDITGVSAGTGLTGGGTSGSVTLDFDVANYGGGQYAAGKNKIINGDFGIWQRGTSVNLSASTTTFLADRFACYMDSNAGTVTYSQQTFTPGTAPVSGYENAYFARLSTGGNGNFSMFAQRIEDVRTFAGQTITVSFWMKSSTAKTFTILVRQDFGSGGSSVVDQSTTYTTTTSWARYSATFTLGSLSGKTIGTGSSLLIQPVAYGAQTGNFTIDIWGVQVEAGSTATPFQTATGTIQGELAACQRYFEVLTAAEINGVCYTTANAYVTVPFKVTKRQSSSTFTYPSSLTNLLYAVGSGYKTPTAVATETYDENGLGFTATGFSTTSMAIGYPLRYTSSTNITISAEL